MKKTLSLCKYQVLILICTYIILFVSCFIFNGSVIETTISCFSITGIIYNTSRKRICFLFFSIYAIGYGVISLINKLYGETIINFLYMFPFYIYSFFKFNKTNTDTDYSIKQLSLFQRFLLVLVILSITLLYGYILKLMGSRLPFLNALLSAFTISCGFLTSKGYLEQWVFWIAVNIASIISWTLTLINGESGLSFIILNIICILLNIQGFVSWLKNAKKDINVL